MISRLTLSERQLSLAIVVLLGVFGLAIAIGGRGEALGVHGFIVLVAALGFTFALIGHYFDPEPPASQLEQYYDDPTRVGIVLTMIWAVIGMFVGVWVAALLAWPDLTFDAAWASFGRLRPVHTSGVIFGFGGNALIATSFHVLQRSSP